MPTSAGQGVCAFCATYVPPTTVGQQLDVLVNRIDIIRADGNDILQGLPNDAPLFAVTDLVIALNHIKRAAVSLDKASDALEADAQAVRR
ncbi:hypothetical protein [Mycolicibacterium fluoranthenivorans]|uniref:hypothetical protein n=1 Tax=Mycolicibacterium fluoranthenivorans TaxID=258505 RepID=UPI000B86D42C|nr:hypothetical protein [Mycolicibacterium fluoranthenivorans]